MHALKSFNLNGGGPGPTPTTGRFYFLRRNPFDKFWIFLTLVNLWQIMNK